MGKINGCLYRHVRLDTNEVFYIGISKKKERPYDKNKRNKYWKNIVAITKYEIEILLESNDYEFLIKKEIEFIKLYGRKDIKEGTLVNMTDGGEGRNRCYHTDEFKKRVSEMNKLRVGEKNPNYKKKPSQECRNKISIANTGKKRTPEQCLNISKSKINPNKKIKVLKGIAKGENHYFFGKKNEYLRALSKSQIGGKHPRSVKILDTSNNKIYYSIKEASEETGINYNTLRSNLNSNRKNNTNFIYIK